MSWSYLWYLRILCAEQNRLGFELWGCTILRPLEHFEWSPHSFASLCSWLMSEVLPSPPGGAEDKQYKKKTTEFWETGSTKSGFTLTLLKIQQQTTGRELLLNLQLSWAFSPTQTSTLSGVSTNSTAGSEEEKVTLKPQNRHLVLLDFTLTQSSTLTFFSGNFYLRVCSSYKCRERRSCRYTPW